jgi:hypothetical protein
MKNIFKLTDDEIESCFDGSSSASMVREILEKDGVVANGVVDVDQFAQWFAYGVEGFIDEDPTSAAWQEAWRNNYEWGNNIAENINDLVKA